MWRGIDRWQVRLPTTVKGKLHTSCSLDLLWAQGSFGINQLLECQMCRVDCSQQRMLTLTGTPDPRVTVGCTCISTWSQCLPWCTVSFNSISYHITTDLNTKFLSGSRRVNWYLTSLQEQFWKRSNTTRAFPICWGVSDEFWFLPLVLSMTRQGHVTSGSVSEDIGCFFFQNTKSLARLRSAVLKI